MKVMSDLLAQAYIRGIDLNEFVEFFASQAQSMFNYPRNCRLTGTQDRVWLMRGFYPGSSIFFKLSIIPNRNQEYFDTPYYVKVSLPTVNGRKQRYNMFGSKELNDYIVDKMENSVFNAGHDIKPLIDDTFRMPRCMSPKGMKIFRYEKPTRKKDAAKKS